MFENILYMYFPNLNFLNVTLDLFEKPETTANTARLHNKGAVLYFKEMSNYNYVNLTY